MKTPKISVFFEILTRATRNLYLVGQDVLIGVDAHAQPKNFASQHNPRTQIRSASEARSEIVNIDFYCQ